MPKHIKSNPLENYIARNLQENIEKGDKDFAQLVDTQKDYITKPQPKPTKGKVDIYPLVMQDIETRVETGKSKYNTVLQSHNGRDALIDAYQEAIDLVFYLRQLITERDG